MQWQLQQEEAEFHPIKVVAAETNLLPVAREHAVLEKLVDARKIWWVVKFTIEKFFKAAEGQIKSAHRVVLATVSDLLKDLFAL